MGFSVRIVDLDFYMIAPVEGLDVNYSKFRGSSVSQVPVLRLFGTTLEGQKICVHIHGVFPYLYIPYDGSQEANGLMYRIASLIDKSINVSLNQGSSNTQHVYKISLVSGIPMYGYHSRPHQFFKICLYNPILIKKLSNLLMNECTLGQIYQPHETHLNFTLQFMMDYNLHGMSFMNLSEIKFRRNLNQKNYGIADDLFLPLHIKKTTVCELEADVLAQNITNREQVTSGHIAANPGILCLWEDERQRRKKNGNPKELEHFLELTRVDVVPTKSHLVFKQALKERLALFSSEQNTVNKLNLSVYPAETPENLNVQPASDNDSDISSSLELSLDDTVCDLDATMTNESSMMEEDQELFNILNKLGDLSDDIEDDSILSQVVRTNDEEAELDMTLPLENSPVNTPCKSDDEFDNILIPQLDGECDDRDNSSQENYSPSFGSVQTDKTKKAGTKKPLKKALFVKLASTREIELKMDKIIENLDPICVRCRGRLITKKKSKKPFKKKLDVKKRNATELKIFSFHMKRMKNQNQLSAVIRKLHEKERQILIHTSRNSHPIFRIVSRRDQRAPYITKESGPEKEIEKINPLSDILLSTNGYVEPSLHIIVKLPDDHSFLYTYKNMYPEVTELPEPPKFLCEHKKEEFLLQIIKLLLKDLEVRASPDISNSKESTDLREREDQELEEVMEICPDLKYLNDSGYLNDLPINNDDQQNAEIIEFYPDMPKLEDYGDLNNVLSKCEGLEIERVMNICPDFSNLDDSGYLNDLPIKNDDQQNAEIIEVFPDMSKLEDYGDLNNVSTKCEGLGIEKVKAICPDLPNLDDSGYLNDLPAKNDDQDHAGMVENGLDMQYCEYLDFNGSTQNDQCVDNCDKNNQKNYYISQKYESYLCDINYKIHIGEIQNKTLSERHLLIEHISAELMKHIKILNTLKLGHYDQTENDINHSNKNSNDVTTRLKHGNDSNSKDYNSNLNVTREDVNVSLASEVTDTSNLDCHDEIKKQRKLLFIDGANDTSSEDEDFIPMTPPPYTQSSVSRSSSRQQKRKRITTMLENDSVIQTSKDISTSYCEPVTSDSSRINLCKPGTSQADGTSHSINVTVVEEKRVCAFNSALSTKIDLIEQKASVSHHCLQHDKPSTSNNIKDHLMEETQKSYLNLSSEPQQDDLENFSSGSHEEIEYLEESDSVKIDRDSTAIITPQKVPPTVEEVVDSLSKYSIPHVRQQEPFFSKTQDVGASIKLGFTVLKVNGQTTTHLQEFESQTNGLNIFRKKVIKDFQFEVPESKSILNNIALSFCNFDTCIVKPVKEPPTPEEVEKWIKANHNKEKDKQKNHAHKDELHVPVNLGGGNNDDDMDISLSLSLSEPHSSQKLDETPSSTYQSSDGDNKHTSSNSSYNSYIISGVSLNDTYAFRKPTEDLKEVRVFVENQHITLMVMELHVLTRGDFKPDPLLDPIQAIFFSIFNDVPQNSKKPVKYKGAIAIDPNNLKTDVHVPLLNALGVACDIFYVQSEEELFKEFTKVVNFWDPDIVSGYEIEMASWGYLIERGVALQFNMKHNLGRNSLEEPKKRGEDHPRELKLIGRIVLDVWRLMRHEIALQSYTFESIVYNILRKRVPYYNHKTLTLWWNDNTNLYRHRVVKYYLLRVDTVLELFDKLDFINRTSELARLFGILFYEVLSRGSQFRVESMMLRLAKPFNFIPVSPSTQQRAHMKAPEYISLVLEPESKLYNDPVIVLDFQSLYPSLIIAYNYCFTTCVGRVENLGKNGPFEFGTTQLKVSRKRLQKLLKRDLLNFSPCGVGFVKKEVRDGIMPRMLREILDTRLMVKNSMKENKNDHNLQKVLHNRQLGLKLIANVTYGYTAANFSGRMPAVELGDSVVSKGRETLQRAIELVENTPEWEAKVVYGDTDSLFVMVPGRSREHAFEIGAKIADAVTKSNPDPVKLKLEKVYQPCILQTKKRYVGYMYESPDQKEPVYEAKGIETVRRDGIPATTKMLEKCLRILFETKDVSLVKKYVIKQFTKILTGRASMQDLTFAKEYRGAAGYQPGACVPALELARKWRAIDRRNEPRSGERVPYVIVHGPPDVPLIRLVRSPRDLLNDCFLKLHAIYYITKAIIPPINRCFNLIGVDLFTWFNDMQRKKAQYLHAPTTPDKKSTISQYFVTTCCVVCGVQTQDKICKQCISQDQLQNTTLTLMEKLKKWEENYYNCLKICQSCTYCQDDVKCVSLDCPVLYRRVQTNHDLKQESYVRQLIPPDISF